jgi:hypothetical protein
MNTFSLVTGISTYRVRQNVQRPGIDGESRSSGPSLNSGLK